MTKGISLDIFDFDFSALARDPTTLSVNAQVFVDTSADADGASAFGSVTGGSSTWVSASSYAGPDGTSASVTVGVDGQIVRDTSTFDFDGLF